MFRRVQYTLMCYPTTSYMLCKKFCNVLLLCINIPKYSIINKDLGKKILSFLGFIKCKECGDIFTVNGFHRTPNPMER
jgi:hypothetical protein